MIAFVLFLNLGKTLDVTLYYLLRYAPTEYSIDITKGSDIVSIENVTRTDNYIRFTAKAGAKGTAEVVLTDPRRDEKTTYIFYVSSLGVVSKNSPFGASGNSFILPLLLTVWAALLFAGLIMAQRKELVLNAYSFHNVTRNALILFLVGFMVHSLINTVLNKGLTRGIRSAADVFSFIAAVSMPVVLLSAFVVILIILVNNIIRAVREGGGKTAILRIIFTVLFFVFLTLPIIVGARDHSNIALDDLIIELRYDILQDPVLAFVLLTVHMTEIFMMCLFFSVHFRRSREAFGIKNVYDQVHAFDDVLHHEIRRHALVFVAILLFSAAVPAIMYADDVTGYRPVNTDAKYSLSNKDASAKTVEVFDFICENFGTNIITCQQESTWMGSPDYEMDYLLDLTGKLSAMRGLEYTHPQKFWR